MSSKRPKPTRLEMLLRKSHAKKVEDSTQKESIKKKSRGPDQISKNRAKSMRCLLRGQTEDYAKNFREKIRYRERVVRNRGRQEVVSDLEKICRRYEEKHPPPKRGTKKKKINV